MSEGLQQVRKWAEETTGGGYALHIGGSLVTDLWDACQHDSDRITELESELATFQESEFHPDWSLLKATRETAKELTHELATAHKLLTDLQGCIIGADMIRRLNAFVEENGGEMGGNGKEMV